MVALIKQECMVRLDDATAVKNVTEEPGVYAFHNEQGAPLYIGKAKNLRRRVSGYLRRLNPYLEDRTRRMIHQARQLQLFATETELLALLLEDQLIKEYKPEFNIRQKDIFKHRYLTFCTGDYPALEMVEEAGGSGRLVYGPYRDKYVAEDIRDIVSKWFGIRPCPDPMPGQTCSYYDIKICPGPCRSHITVEDYAHNIEEAAAFLAGDETALADRMAASMADHSRQMQFEKATEIVRTIEFCHRLAKRQRFFRSFSAERLLLYERGKWEGTYLFSKGCVVEHHNEIIPRENFNIIAKGRETTSSADSYGDERMICDRSNIIYSWINRHGSEHYFMPDG